ncbi:HAD family hydrolase [Oceanobacillus sp. 1P07AA]|uniref:HAD family hydrolase n=1 Tax=Oceanobacillus sp. 1P07AA TaxID=3132293 RepID=UPI0039A559E2
MAKAIIFDLDDTLLWDKKSVQDAFNITCDAANREKNIDPKKLENSVKKHARRLYASYDTYEFTKKIGINPFEGLWATFDDKGIDFEKLKEIAPLYQKDAWNQGLQEVGIKDENYASQLANAFRENRKRTACIFSDAIEVLEKLYTKLPLVLLTNGSPSLQNLKLELSPELVPYFEHIIISGGVGVGKPDTEIFDLALSRLELLSEDVLMVGDNLHTDIIGANRQGIPSVWLNRFDLKNDTDIQPVYEIKSLDELLKLVESMS